MRSTASGQAVVGRRWCDSSVHGLARPSPPHDLCLRLTMPKALAHLQWVVSRTFGLRVAVEATCLVPPERHAMHTMILTLALVGFLLAGGFAEAHGRSSRVGQVGWASWYGKFHHGRPTASGERFSMHRLTAAHRTLPLGTTVVVTNLRTRQQVVVRITDRGPYAEPRRRMIDLSRAAAQRIGLEKPGLGPVRVVVKRPPRRPTTVATGMPRSAKASPSRLVGREHTRRSPGRVNPSRV